MSRRRIAALSAFWGLGMFVAFWFTFESRPSAGFLAVVFLICMVGGAAWGAAMLGFLWLVGRYAGTHGQVMHSGSRTPSQRGFHIASLAFSVAPVLYGALAEYDYLWPALAAAIGPMLAMLPLWTRRVSPLIFWMRSALGFLLGLGASIAVHAFVAGADALSIPSRVWFVASLCSASWSVSYVLAFKARGAYV